MRGNVTHDFKYLTRLPSSVSSLVAYPSPSWSIDGRIERVHTIYTSLDHQRATSPNIFRPLTRDQINFEKFETEKNFSSTPFHRETKRRLLIRI